MQEGISSEASSLAGHLKLGNLICIYDDNHITIDGSTSISFDEDVAKRYEAYGWEVLYVENGNEDLDAIYNAIQKAKESKDKPTLIKMTTTIGYGSLMAGSHSVHGAPLKSDDIKQMKKKFGFDPEKSFCCPTGSLRLIPDQDFDSWSERPTLSGMPCSRSTRRSSLQPG